MAAQVHVISKEDISKHATVQVDPQPAPLADGSVRVRSKLLSITLNNRTYALRGTLLKWWDTYPVPGHLPAPYNNTEQWGIVPSWGYGQVVDSRNPEIPAGTLLFGFWPTSSLPVDLQLKPTDTSGYFFEASKHRQTLMTLYNRYEAVIEQHAENLQAWNSAVMTVWSAGYFLAEYCFPAGQSRPIHPFGGGWTERDADLTSTVVVSLAASSKTARGLSWALSQRDVSNSPLAVLEATSVPETLHLSSSKSFATKAVSYDDVNSEVITQWITKLRPQRILVADCGAPPGVVQRFHDTVMTSNSAPSTFHLICIGGGRDVLSTTDPKARTDFLNTSALMDTAIASSGLDSVYGGRSAAFKEWLNPGAMGALELQWGSGVKGIDDAWEDMMGGRLPRNKALVFRI